MSLLFASIYSDMKSRYWMRHQVLIYVLIPWKNKRLPSEAFGAVLKINTSTRRTLFKFRGWPCSCLNFFLLTYILTCRIPSSRIDISLSAVQSLQLFYMYQWTTLAFVNCIIFLTIKVVRLDERDRYRQLVAQFTTIQTPESVSGTWNRTVDEPLHVETDFLTRTRSHGR